MRNGKNGTSPVDFSRHAREARIAHQAIVDYERDVEKSLARVKRRAIEPATRATALDAIFADEEAPHCSRCGWMVELPAQLEQFGIRKETIERLADFCSFDGVEPWNVARNLYAVFAHMGLRPWCALTLREQSVMLGESHGSVHLRIKKFVDFLRRQNAASFKAPGQKQVESGSSYSKCQEGNTNRRRQNRPRHRARKWKEKKRNE